MTTVETEQRHQAPLRAAHTRRSDDSVVHVLLNLGRGGMEAMAVGLASSLQRSGRRAVVIALDAGGEHEALLREANVGYHVLDGRHFRSPRFHLRLARILRAERARVVHTHHFATLVHALPAIKLAGVRRLVHTEHSFQYLRERSDIRWTLRGMSWLSDGFVVVGSEMKAFYRDRVRVPADRLHVVQNGVDADRYGRPVDVDFARARLGLPAGFLVGTAGRLFAEKDYAVLIRALQLVTPHRPDVRLVLIGDGPERTDLENLASTLGIRDRVHFLGWRHDVPELLPLIDVFALSSRHEGLPLVILEAMAAGLPIVSTPVGDLPQVVPAGEAGLYYPIGAPDALADHLLQLAADPTLRARLGSAGAARVRRLYSHDTMVQRYLQLYAV